MLVTRYDVTKEQELNQHDIWKKNKRYHVFQLPFDENMAENSKGADLKKDYIHCYVSFVLYSSIIEKGCIDATFLQGLRNNM